MEYLFKLPEMPEPRPSPPRLPSIPQVEVINQLPLATDSQDQTPVQPLQIIAQERTPAPHSAVGLRIQKPQPPGPKILILIKSNAQTDWQFCQKKAMEFELSDDPPRFPILVADVQGYEAPGCDI